MGAHRASLTLISAQVIADKSKMDASSWKLSLPAMDGFGEYEVSVQLHKKVKVALPLKLVEA